MRLKKPLSTVPDAAIEMNFERNRLRSMLLHLRHMWIVTLPAQIFLTVGEHVDFRRIFCTHVLGVTFSAERSLCGDGCTDDSRRKFVPLGRGVTDRAFKLHVRRQRLRAGNSGMTRRTFRRSFRWPGIVRIMAFNARLQRVVRRRNDLGETGRSGRIVNVAA